MPLCGLLCLSHRHMCFKEGWRLPSCPAAEGGFEECPPARATQQSPARHKHSPCCHSSKLHLISNTLFAVPCHAAQAKSKAAPPAPAVRQASGLDSRLRRETPFICNMRFKTDLPEVRNTCHASTDWL